MTLADGLGDTLQIIRQSLGGLALLVIVGFAIWYYVNKSGVTVLQAALVRNDKDRADLESRVDKLEATSDRQQVQIDDQQSQIDNQRKWRAIAVRHIRDLRDFIRDRISDHEEMPEVPAGLDLDD